MSDYISREVVIKKITEVQDKATSGTEDVTYYRAIKIIREMPTADVQPVNQCKMIPQNPDCRGYTDTFLCTNCQLHIHLGFIGQRYGGNYCIECGAEVGDGDQND